MTKEEKIVEVETPEENPMEPTEEQKEITLPLNEYNEVVEKLALNEQAVSNLTGEIKDLRKRREETPIVPVVEDQTDIQKVIAEELAKRDSEMIIRNREKAMDKFFNEHPEFDSANDVAGLKFKDFEKNLSRLNTTNANSVEDFEGLFKDTLSLMGVKNEVTVEVPTRQASTPSSKVSPESKPEENLTDVELRLVDKTFGGDIGQYVKMRDKNPDYVETLLEYTK